MNFLIKQFIVLISNFSDLLELIFRAPLRWYQKKAKNRSTTTWYGKAALFPVYILGSLFNLAATLTTSPLKIFSNLLQHHRSDLLASLPCVIAFAVVVFVVLRVNLFGQQIESRYRTKSQVAILAGNFDKAKVYLSRIVNDWAEPSPEDLFTLAQALGQSGESDRASAIINELAPTDKAGYGPAHKLLALGMAPAINTATQERKSELLIPLRWHLEHANDDKSQEINQAWTLYYMSVEQPENAVRHMKKAAELNPSLLLSAGDIYKSMNENLAAQQMYRQAKNVFAKALADDPFDWKNRILLARAYTKTNELQEAEKVLIAGNQLNPDKKYKRALAEFYVMWHDITSRSQNGFDSQFRVLQQAIEFDVDYVPIYERLIGQYQRADSTAESQEIRSMLESAIATGESTSLAHFALGNLLWIEQDFKQAEWHINQAYRLDDRLAVVGNNLAWLLAHRDPPELEQASNLIKGVVSKRPNDARFRDTFATILMKQGQLEDALVEFEKTLPLIRNKKPLHKKMAEIYSKLGNPELAKLHAKLAK
jgi:tetratricopeptide (TPR) repeat protein